LLKKEINKPLLKEYFQDIEEISRELSLEKSNLLEVLMSLPDVMLTPEKGIADDEWQLVTDTVNQAIEKVNSFREQEGESLKNDLLGYASVIEQKALEIDGMKAERLKNIKERLRGQVSEIAAKDGYDEGRLELELIYYSEKLDITEEIVRLKSHLDHYRQSLDEDNPGKKLGFIAQEIGREINTIGSKANDSRIQRTVVEMKDELEKMREQLLNIL